MNTILAGCALQSAKTLARPVFMGSGPRPAGDPGMTAFSPDRSPGISPGGERKAPPTASDGVAPTVAKTDCIPLHPIPLYTSIPTTAPDMQPAIAPERIERRPSATISGRRSGTIAPIPPIRMPRLPKLAKPHSA